ncbi:MAG TPA: deaminase [Spirochaetota bacterium]|nr:deaminase [Spirochaetota bacterium]HOL57327.1 deaminase [Spirochaetota bacterium]HPP04888.1 deaminase [Spirochaetota bacterium]
MENRPTWDQYFLNIAKAVSTRSSCLRNKVGAVIVRDKDIISTGYNGAPQYQKNCLEIGYCYRNKKNILSGTQLEKCRAVGSHAEANAITLAARNGHSTKDGTIYIVGHNFVCNQCKALIANANIKRVVLLKVDGTIVEFFPEKDWNVHPIDSE